MNQIEKSLENLMAAIKDSDEFKRYQQIKEKVHGFPEIEGQIMEFRKKNFNLQNYERNVDLYEEVDKMELEYREFRKNPLVAEYLSTENAICKMVQQINWTMVEGLDFEVGFEE